MFKSERRAAEMKRHIVQFMTFTVLMLVPHLAKSAVKVGQPAPDFTGTASNGRTYHLADYQGKYVVLEWHNNGCPYTRKHYESGNMQKLQKQWTAQGVIWFTVISSAPGKQGYIEANDENKYMTAMAASPTAALLDPSGDIGHLYDAKTTPQMIVINPNGVVIYDGAIDNRPTDEVKDIPGATNYVNLALTQAISGRSVQTAATRPYGCSVKYRGSWF
jgi:peroxiredoxin